MEAVFELFGMGYLSCYRKGRERSKKKIKKAQAVLSSIQVIPLIYKNLMTF